VPTAVPTSADAAHFDFTGVCPEEWTGSWTGASTCDITYAHVDPATGAVEGTIVDTFTGVYMDDHSHGTLTMDETFTGNLFTGSGVLQGVIVAGGGDPTFACSSGDVTIPVYLNAVGSYGGYQGTWNHGCPGAESRQPSAQPSGPSAYGATRGDATTVAGGFTSIPLAVPTSADAPRYNFTGLCPETWQGDWVGDSVCDFTFGHVDPTTGDARAEIIDTFTGTYLGDHSAGTLVIKETFTGNVFTGAGIAEGEIISSFGDPTFACSSGHITIPIYFNPAGAYGGFYGNWIHGCTPGR
jgi:hypothetical protein